MMTTSLTNSYDPPITDFGLLFILFLVWSHFERNHTLNLMEKQVQNMLRMCHGLIEFLKMLVCLSHVISSWRVMKYLFIMWLFYSMGHMQPTFKINLKRSFMSCVCFCQAVENIKYNKYLSSPIFSCYAMLKMWNIFIFCYSLLFQLWPLHFLEIKLFTIDN